MSNHGLGTRTQVDAARYLRIRRQVLWAAENSRAAARPNDRLTCALSFKGEPNFEGGLAQNAR